MCWKVLELGPGKYWYTLCRPGKYWHSRLGSIGTQTWEVLLYIMQTWEVLALAPAKYWYSDLESNGIHYIWELMVPRPGKFWYRHDMQL